VVILAVPSRSIGQLHTTNLEDGIRDASTDAPDATTGTVAPRLDIERGFEVWGDEIIPDVLSPLIGLGKLSENVSTARLELVDGVCLGGLFRVVATQQRLKVRQNAT